MLTELKIDYVGDCRGAIHLLFNWNDFWRDLAGNELGLDISSVFSSGYWLDGLVLLREAFEFRVSAVSRHKL